MTTEAKIDEMIAACRQWLAANDYKYIECNYVPPRFFTKNHKINVLLRTFFRLYPYNLRSRKDIVRSPDTPQSCVAMLKAFALDESSRDVTEKLLERIKSLRSSKTKDFALRQGIKIAINLYEDGGDDPTPLNTVWFGETLLTLEGIDEEYRRETLLSICSYLINELGFADYGERGIYFYYGHRLKDLIYNASAIISSFLIKVGAKYDDESLIAHGRRGLTFIMESQNEDGSWFYYGPPLKKAIDGFHQSYILKALMEAQDVMPLGLEEAIDKGVKFYLTQFDIKGDVAKPHRYEKQYNPKNTWIFQKVDGRDVSEAILFFSLYKPDREMVDRLVNYMYKSLYVKSKQRLLPEIFVYGRNHNDYIEFYGWYLHALMAAKKAII